MTKDQFNWEAKAGEYKALLESIETYSCVCLTPEIKDPIGDAHARGYNEAVEQIWEAIKDVLENKEGVK